MAGMGEKGEVSSAGPTQPTSCPRDWLNWEGAWTLYGWRGTVWKIDFGLWGAAGSSAGSSRAESAAQLLVKRAKKVNYEVMRVPGGVYPFSSVLVESPAGWKTY